MTHTRFIPFQRKLYGWIFALSVTVLPWTLAGMFCMLALISNAWYWSVLSGGVLMSDALVLGWIADQYQAERENREVQG